MKEIIAVEDNKIVVIRQSPCTGSTDDSGGDIF